jgi:hypothetical protein
MSVLDLALPDALEARTRTYVAEAADYLDHALAAVEPKMLASINKLKGREALFVKKRYLDAPTRWEKFFWYRLGAHHLAEATPLEEACRLAERDLIALDALRHPM